MRYVVRHGSMRHLGEFAAESGLITKRGDRVVVRSKRGTESGVVLCEGTARTREWLGRGAAGGQLLRLETAHDAASAERAEAQAKAAFDVGRKAAEKHSLAMQIVDAEWLLGGEKALFYFTADARVDFRELVKTLARRLKTRIEMRQIGVRDEAKLLADYGDCGKPVCCGTHLQEMPPVSMKMAKLQKASLDPAKITGRCGRLKCCLRYEYDTYEEAHRELPRPGKWVQTADGVGRVVAQELLARKLLVSFEGGRRVMIDGSAVLDVVPAPARQQKKPTSGGEAVSGDTPAGTKKKRKRRRGGKRKPGGGGGGGGNEGAGGESTGGGTRPDAGGA